MNQREKDIETYGEPGAAAQAFADGAMYGRAHVIYLLRCNAKNTPAREVSDYLYAMARLMEVGTK